MNLQSFSLFLRGVGGSHPPSPFSPLFSPKYSVCCAVLDHCSEELSDSFTRQVSVTVPPTDTVSSEVTGCKRSSPRKQQREGRSVMRKDEKTCNRHKKEKQKKTHVREKAVARSNTQIR